MKNVLCVVFGLVLFAAGCFAGPVMPDFATAPTGWVTDRYEPALFDNIGPYQGKANVIAVGVDSTGGKTSRPPSYTGDFYNTQGRKILVNGGPGTSLQVLLWVPQSWSDPNNGHRSAGLWGSSTNAANQIAQYPIIGFTNFGPQGPTFRAYDGNAGGYINALSAPIVYDGWNRLQIDFNPGAFAFYANNTLLYTDTTINGSVDFHEAFLNVYNFHGYPGSIATDYTTYWANTPEPGTWVLLVTSLGGVVWMRRRGVLR